MRAAQCWHAGRAWIVSLSCRGVRSKGDTSPAASSHGWNVPLIFRISALRSRNMHDKGISVGQTGSDHIRA